MKRIKSHVFLQVLIEDPKVQENSELCLVATVEVQPDNEDEQTYIACRSGKQTTRAESCTIDGCMYPSFTHSTMYGDSCASCHLDNDDTGLTDV